MAVPNTFASATSAIPLANLDANFAYYDAAYSITGTTVSFNGNVGIGVTPSAWTRGPAFELKGTTVTYINSPSAQAFSINSNNYFGSGGNIYNATGYATQYAQYLGQHIWYTAPSGTAGTAITFTQAMTLDASGRLLIGTTSVSGNNYLQVNSDALINGLTVGRGAGAVSTNTAVGASALAANTTGTENTAVGANSLLSNTTGITNTAIGLNTLRTNISGQENTALGHQVLYANTGSYNTGAGTNTLRFNTSGANNTAFGYNSLFSNTTASNNTAVGYQAGYTNITGSYNTFIGNKAGYASNVNGNGLNACIGHQAGAALTTGTYNTFVGGADSGNGVTTGSKNTILGNYTGSAAPISATGSNYIVLSDGDGNVRQVIDSSGNVGIGTSSPYTPLDVVQKTSDTTYALQLRGYTTGADGARTANMRAVDSANASWANMGSYATSWIWNYQGTAERMRLDSSGNLLVGTTSALATTTHSFVASGASGGAPMASRNSGATAGKYWTFGPDTSNNYRVFNNGGTGMYMVDGATAWTASSDERKKDIIEPIIDATNKVSSLRAVIGKYKTDANGVRRSFLIAQDVQAVFPEAVNASNPNELGVQYTDVIPLLVAAIKEQQAFITALTARITALESK